MSDRIDPLPGQMSLPGTIDESGDAADGNKTKSSFPGGKTHVVRRLINEMPPHRVYFAGCAGHDAVARFKRPAETTILCELAADVVDAWKRNPHVLGTGRQLGDIVAPCYACQNASAALRHSPECCATQVGDRGPVDLHIWQLCGVDAVEWLFGLHGHSVRLGGDSIKPFPPAAMVGRTLDSRLSTLDFQPTDWLCYFDPPYPWCVRSDRNNYGEHEWSDEDHERFLGVVTRLPCHVMVSSYSSGLDGSPNSLYIETFAKARWRRIEYETKDRGNNTRLESCWMNFSKPVELHDYSFLGGDYREREKLRRLERRHVEQIKAMDPQRRLALLDVLAREFC